MPEPRHLPESDFLRLFVKHEEALRAFARVLLPTWEAVDEVMQEASVVMWKKLAQLEAADDLLPWANLYVSMLQRLGIDAEKFGSSTGTVRGLEA